MATASFFGWETVEAKRRFLQIRVPWYKEIRVPE